VHHLPLTLYFLNPKPQTPNFDPSHQCFKASTAKQWSLLLPQSRFECCWILDAFSTVTRHIQQDNSLFSGIEKRAAELMDVLRRKKKSRDAIQLSPVSASVSGAAAPFVSPSRPKIVTPQVTRHSQYGTGGIISARVLRAGQASEYHAGVHVVDELSVDGSSSGIVWPSSSSSAAAAAAAAAATGSLVLASSTLFVR
jgi:hypothetical protein